MCFVAGRSQHWRCAWATRLCTRAPDPQSARPYQADTRTCCHTQAPDPDVEGVVLHADGGAVTPARICRGPGSYSACLLSLGEPPEAGAAPAPDADTQGQEGEEPRAATVG